MVFDNSFWNTFLTEPTHETESTKKQKREKNTMGKIFSLKLTLEEVALLEQAARIDNRPRSNFIREAIRRYSQQVLNNEKN